VRHDCPVLDVVAMFVVVVVVTSSIVEIVEKDYYVMNPMM
jgi:hypothetical protein